MKTKEVTSVEDEMNQLGVSLEKKSNTVTSIRLISV
jgi:hypothetical protein